MLLLEIECFSHIVPSHGNISLCTPTFLTDHLMYQQVIYSLLLFVLSPLCSFICNPCLSKCRCRSIGRSSKHDVNHLYRVLMHIIGLFSLENTPLFQNKGLLFPQWTTLENPFLLLGTTWLSDAFKRTSVFVFLRYCYYHHRHRHHLFLMDIYWHGTNSSQQWPMARVLLGHSFAFNFPTPFFRILPVSNKAVFCNNQVLIVFISCFSNQASTLLLTTPSAPTTTGVTSRCLITQSFPISLVRSLYFSMFHLLFHTLCDPTVKQCPQRLPCFSPSQQRQRQAFWQHGHLNGHFHVVILMMMMIMVVVICTLTFCAGILFVHQLGTRHAPSISNPSNSFRS